MKCRPLEAVAAHLFTSRESKWSADASRCMPRAMNVDAVVTVSQVHGRDVVVVRRESPRERGVRTGDVLVSDDPRAAVAVRAADCVPLLMADARTGAVAAVHAGWRGTAASAATAAVHALEREFGAKPQDLVVAIGPSIGACCYEVGTELVDAFTTAGHAAHLIENWFVRRPSLRLDLPAANRDQLLLAGVPDAQIYLCGLCTAMHLDVLTSYRAEKEQAGRITAAIRARS